MNMTRLLKEIRLLRFASRLARAAKLVSLIAICLPLLHTGRALWQLTRRA